MLIAILFGGFLRREKGEAAQPSCSSVSIANKYKGVATSNHNRAPPNCARGIINLISTIRQLSCIYQSLVKFEFIADDLHRELAGNSFVWPADVETLPGDQRHPCSTCISPAILKQPCIIMPTNAILQYTSLTTRIVGFITSYR